MRLLPSVIFLTLFVSLGFAQGRNEQLYHAVTKNNTETVAKLLKEGADANYFKEEGWVKVSVLITAVNNQNIEVVKMLLEHKADVHWRDGFKTTAIMYAANSGRVDVIKLLLEYGANITDSDGEGNTVLTAAKESRNGEMIAFVQAKLDEQATKQ